MTDRRGSNGPSVGRSARGRAAPDRDALHTSAPRPAGPLVAVLLLTATSFGVFFAPPHATAAALMQGEAPAAVQTAAPHEDPGGGVADADTAAGQTTANGPGPVLLLIAAVGLLVGVVVLTRPRRRGPD